MNFTTWSRERRREVNQDVGAQCFGCLLLLAHNFAEFRGSGWPYIGRCDISNWADGRILQSDIPWHQSWRNIRSASVRRWVFTFFDSCSSQSDSDSCICSDYSMSNTQTRHTAYLRKQRLFWLYDNTFLFHICLACKLSGDASWLISDHVCMDIDGVLMIRAWIFSWLLMIYACLPAKHRDLEPSKILYHWP